MVQVDKLGQAQAVAAATADYTPSDPQIAWYLAHFIEMVRSLPADPIIVRQNWLQAYDFTTTSGSQALNDYARANDPFAKLGKQQIAIDVSSVIRASPSSFRVEWIEHHYEDGGARRHLALDRDPHRGDPAPILRRRAPHESARHLHHRHQLVEGVGTMTPADFHGSRRSGFTHIRKSAEPGRKDYVFP